MADRNETVSAETLARLRRLTERLGELDRQMTAAGRSAAGAADAVGSAATAMAQAARAMQAIPALMGFDEINRLQEKTASSSSGSSGSSKKSSSSSSSAEVTVGKIKVGDTAELELPVSLERQSREAADEVWTDFQVSLERSGADTSAGVGVVTRLGQGIRTGFGNVGSWVNRHIRQPIQTGWAALGALAVTIGAKLRDTAQALWNKFKEAWNTGAEKAVEIGNTLRETAQNLWNRFKEAWNNGVEKAVEIGNALRETAQNLWNRFKEAWNNGVERAVSIGNSLKNTASNLWSSFKEAWNNGTERAVSITNSLRSTAASLWSGFKENWNNGTERVVSITNKLKSTAGELWQQFKSGWGGKTLSLKVTYSTDVGSVKRAVYKALGLQGWPTLSFAARGGIVEDATLLGSTVAGEDGAEAIVPLERHTEWLDAVADRLAEKLGGGGAGGAPLTVQVLLDGRVVGETSVRYINGRLAQGQNPLNL